MLTKPLFVRAEWDEDAEVWVATSDDVPGLATEEDNLERLIKKLKIVPWSRCWEWPFAILNSDIKRGLRVLSAGCIGDPLPKYCMQKGCETHGIDLANHSLPGLNFKIADIRHTPYKTDYFDRIFCISVIEHIWDNPMNSIKELLRILKPVGRLAITTDINRGESSFLFHQSNFDGLVGLALEFETGKIPEDVLKSEDSEIGVVCGSGLSVFGFVIEK